MVAFAKVARAELSAFEVVFWRGMVGTPIMFWFARKRLRVQNVPVLALRVILGFATVVLLMASVQFLGVAEISLLHKLQPVLLAGLAPFVLGRKERVGPELWLLLFAGLGGCALILAPDLSIGSYWGLLPLAAAATSAGAQLCLPVLMRTEGISQVVFYFFLASVPLAALLELGSSGSLPAAPQGHMWWWAIGVGVSAVVAQTLLTMAYRDRGAARIAAASYTGPVWALIVDAVFFAIFPAPLELAGGILIILCGLLLVFRKDRPAPLPLGT